MSTRPIDAILGKMPGTNKWRKDFFRHILHLFLSMRGRHNFENKERYGTYNECSYRQNFEKPFDFALFNRELIQQTCRPERVPIENTPSMLENFTEYLEMNSYEVYATENEKRGVELAAEACPDLIIFSALMSGIDGFEVLRLITNTGAAPKIPFVFSTSLYDKLSKAEALALFAEDYLVKPFEFFKLLEVARKWTGPGSKKQGC